MHKICNYNKEIAGLAFGWQTPRSGCYWRKFLSDNLAATYDVDAFGQGGWVGAQVATVEGVDDCGLGGLGLDAPLDARASAAYQILELE